MEKSLLLYPIIQFGNCYLRETLNIKNAVQVDYIKHGGKGYNYSVIFRIFQLQFHTGFIPLDTTVLKFTK